MDLFNYVEISVCDNLVQTAKTTKQHENCCKRRAQYNYSKSFHFQMPTLIPNRMTCNESQRSKTTEPILKERNVRTR